MDGLFSERGRTERERTKKEALSAGPVSFLPTGLKLYVLHGL